MPDLTLGDGTVAYERHGDGAPVVLLHSLGGAGAMWQSTVAALASRCQAFTLDARGHGESSDDGEISVDQYARDAIMLVRQLGLRDVRLVGLSMGAQAAMIAAAELGDTVVKLVLADTLLGAGGVGAEERLAVTRARIAEIGNAAFAMDYAKSRTLPTTDVTAVADFAHLVERTLPEIYPRLQYSIASQSLHATARGLKTDTLVLVGDKDISTPPEKAQEIAAAITGAGLLIVPDANHLSNLDNPDFFNEAVARFI